MNDLINSPEYMIGVAIVCFIFGLVMIRVSPDSRYTILFVLTTGLVAGIKACYEILSLVMEKL